MAAEQVETVDIEKKVRALLQKDVEGFVEDNCDFTKFGRRPNCQVDPYTIRYEIATALLRKIPYFVRDTVREFHQTKTIEQMADMVTMLMRGEMMPALSQAVSVREPDEFGSDDADDEDSIDHYMRIIEDGRN